MRENAMPSDPNLNDPRSLWQSQEDERMTLTLEEVRRRAARLQRRIYWRNLREYVGGVIVIAVFGASLWHFRGWSLAPPLLLIAGMGYVLFQIHRRGSSRSLPADADLKASLDFHIRELERQRDAARTMWSWYLLPLVPGVVAAIVVAAVDRGVTRALIVFGVALLLMFVVLWRLNESGARKLDRRIQELREMEVNDE
jgi:hypothetical protein